ncbi:MAG: hypothetical protein HC769_14315 [Cyanobacteria bacterium CRU_2_1]|nr:hypothetical protein [Cyanobacteria bacterium RU_5_0]NJR59901.1 hypothetical protein [Cyanobacteria bacterium CRU_2_1]
MTNRSNRPLISPLAQAELELLDFILDDEPTTYPFNVMEPEAEAYFANLEQEVLAAGWSTNEIAEQGQLLSSRLNQLWTDLAELAPVSTVSLPQFAARIPHQLWEQIVHRAQQVVSQNLSLADQLVQCVQDCLPDWGNDDLLMFARPLAYPMRSSVPTLESESLEKAIQSVRSVEWTELTEIEQVRLSLAAARYAISQLPSETEK